MDVFNTQNNVVLVNGDYYVYPWVDGEIALACTLRMYGCGRCAYVTSHVTIDIDPATIKQVQLPNICLRGRVKLKWCKDVIGCAIHHTNYTRFKDAFHTCKPSIMLIREYLDDKMY